MLCFYFGCWFLKRQKQFFNVLLFVQCLSWGLSILKVFIAHIISLVLSITVKPGDILIKAYFKDIVITLVEAIGEKLEQLEIELRRTLSLKDAVRLI